MTDDRDVEGVAAELLALDPNGSRTARVLRDTIDQLYDGNRTGRYRWDQLFKTEKTHCGTLVEINMQREFNFTDGALMDFEIAGHEVDCKYSQTFGGWMVPLEAVNQILLVLTADDSASSWSMGVVRATPERLRGGGNRDSKTSFTAEAREEIIWLHQDALLKENVLLRMSAEELERIFAEPSGLRRLEMLFRLCQDTVLSRNVIATVGHGLDDPLRRIRSGSSGARGRLAAEGIVILGGQEAADLDLARKLGLPRLEKGEFLATTRQA